jgi:hypothetical protein
MTRRLVTLLSAFLVSFPAAAASAQDSGAQSTPAHVSFVEGSVILERDGQRDESPASMPLLAGDRLRTVRGRAEVLFADGSTLHIDQQSTVDFQSDEVLRLIDGRVRLTTTGQGRDLPYRVDAPGGWVQIASTGEYRIAVLRGDREPQIELAVLRGAAELVNEEGRSLVRAGERAFVQAGSQPSTPYVFNSAAWDDFDRWSESRRDQRLGVSAQYLPSDVRPYASTFDQYGSWQYEQPYGYVWYPRAHVGWRPYYRGRWVSLRPYGWTWIAGDPWGWPTHHYGRWGFSPGGWYWIPGPRWGAAWVSWAYAPGYVSWCPLGWNNRPVFSFVNVNIYGGHRYNHWHGWNVVPRRHFGYGYVNTHVVAGHTIDTRTRGAFVVRDSSPDWRGAVPRASVPIRSAGTHTRTGYAVPRGSALSPSVAADVQPGVPSGTRSFPAPAREPRSPGSTGLSRRAPSGVTSAPQRALPRDRAVPSSPAAAPDEASTVQVPGSRVAPQRRGSSGVPQNNVGPTVPPSGIRAVPRSAPDASPQSPQRHGDAYRRGPDGAAPETSPERSRAVPRQETPRAYERTPGYDAPRPSQAPRSYEAPRAHEVPRAREAPRSYQAPRSYEAPRAVPRSESRPPSHGGAPDSRGSSPSTAAPPRPSTDAPSRPSSASPPSRPSGGEGSRSRGSAPSQGQGSRRPSG